MHCMQGKLFLPLQPVVMWPLWKETTKSVFPISTAKLFLVGSVVLLPVLLLSQAKCKVVSPDSSFVVHAVQIKGRWVPEVLKKTVEETIGIGSSFSDSKVSAAVVQVSDETK